MTASCSLVSESAVSSNSTRAFRVAKFTATLRTPASFCRTRSFRAAQAAQCIPPMAKVVVFIVETSQLHFVVGKHDEFGALCHHAHAAVTLEVAGLFGRESDDVFAVGI